VDRLTELTTAPVILRQRRRLPAPLVIGGALVLTLIAVAALAQWIAPYPFDKMHIRDRFLPPNLHYLAGTDEYGRDVFSRLLFGSQLSLALGVTATLISMGIGVPLGLIAGYRRGVTDEVIMRTLDVMLAFPPIMLVLLILAVTRPSVMKTAIAIGILAVAPIARVTRSVALDLMSGEFIEAARARGERLHYLLMRELLPNVWPVLMVEASLRVVFAVLLGAVLSFLGFGVQPPAADWGLMISNGRAFVDTAPWISLAPGIAMWASPAPARVAWPGLFWIFSAPKPRSVARSYSRARTSPASHGRSAGEYSGGGSALCFRIRLRRSTRHCASAGKSPNRWCSSWGCRSPRRSAAPRSRCKRWGLIGQPKSPRPSRTNCQAE
jgi:peptide/nickel transport system permease protein